jgi:hypothetical protein
MLGPVGGIMASAKDYGQGDGGRGCTRYGQGHRWLRDCAQRQRSRLILIWLRDSGLSQLVKNRGIQDVLSIVCGLGPGAVSGS